MNTDVPTAIDEVLGINNAMRNTYWCNFAMVRADYQGRGIAKTLFEMASQEVRSMYPSRVANAALLTQLSRSSTLASMLNPSLEGSKAGRNHGAHYDKHSECGAAALLCRERRYTD